MDLDDAEFVRQVVNFFKECDPKLTNESASEIVVGFSSAIVMFQKHPEWFKWVAAGRFKGYPTNWADDLVLAIPGPAIKDLIKDGGMERDFLTGSPKRAWINFYCDEHDQEYSLTLQHLEGYELKIEDLERGTTMFSGDLKCGCTTRMPDMAEIKQLVGWRDDSRTDM